MTATHIFHVPSMHCAACIVKVEQHIGGLAGVVAARVNLSRKELRVTATQDVRAGAVVEALDALGFPAEALDFEQITTEDKTNPLLIRLAVAGFGMMNVMLLSVAVWAGADAATRQFLHLVSALIGLPILVYASAVFYVNAWRSVMRLRLNMDVPIALAIILAAGLSLYESLAGGQHAYFDAALALTFFLLLGRYLDMQARQKARSAAAHLAKMQTPTAMHKYRGKISEISVDALRVGMLVVVRAGERIPADGVIVKGRADADRSFLTGEAMPIALDVGAEVFAGEMCLNGVLEIKISKTADDSTLRRFIDLVEVAERGRHRYTALADRAAAIYAPLVHCLAILAFCLWLWLGAGVYTALTIAIAVLIITCPCALGLAVPAVMVSASARLFSRGVLIKNATALERMAGVDCIIFDKTGVLTSGAFSPSNLEHWSAEELAILRALARGSRHPLAQSLNAVIPAGKIAKIEDMAEIAGCGIGGTYRGREVRLGKAEWLCAPQESDRYLGFRWGDRGVKWLYFEESVRPEVAEMLARLDGLGIPRILLSGDHADAVARMAERLGFEAFYGGKNPTEKLAVIDACKGYGRVVLMVGDGLNDAGALAAADAAIAPASALDATRATADVILLSGAGGAGAGGAQLKALPDVLMIARQAKRRVLQNFALAALYNMVAVPLAFAGLATPLMAAIAMSLSSLSVVLNAVRPWGIMGQDKGAKP